MQQLYVELGSRSYPIYVGSNLLSTLADTLSTVLNQQIFIITNDVVAPLFLEQVQASLANYQIVVFNMEDGESAKNIQTWQQALDALLATGFARDCTVLALGGGVVGDLAGFVAATFHRGVDFVQVPTTLLSQVDSSVGGKTAVNHAHGKNLIGAFHQPRAVLVDTQCLHSLPARELSAGLAEVIKYGVMADAGFFAWLEDNIGQILTLDDTALSTAIMRSCACKSAVVSDDEREQGQRALLNLGHTFGHAIEQSQGFGKWLHGEAVAVGIAIACDVSWQQGWLHKTDYQRVVTLLRTANLPVTAPQSIRWDEWQRLMLRDKKVKTGKVRFILPTAIGAATMTAEVNEATLQQAVSRQRG